MRHQGLASHLVKLLLLTLQLELPSRKVLIKLLVFRCSRLPLQRLRWLRRLRPAQQRHRLQPLQMQLRPRPLRLLLLLRFPVQLRHSLRSPQ